MLLVLLMLLNSLRYSSISMGSILWCSSVSMSTILRCSMLLGLLRLNGLGLGLGLQCLLALRLLLFLGRLLLGLVLGTSQSMALQCNLCCASGAGNKVTMHVLIDRNFGCRLRHRKLALVSCTCRFLSVSIRRR